MTLKIPPGSEKLLNRPFVRVTYHLIEIFLVKSASALGMHTVEKAAHQPIAATLFGCTQRTLVFLALIQSSLDFSSLWNDLWLLIRFL